MAATRGPEDGGLARMAALGDGVMAFAMTLLVLDLPRPSVAPDAGTAAFLQAVAAGWPALLTMVVGFLYIALFWVNHHHMLRHIRRADHNLLVLNALFLLTIVLVPFATALLAESFGQPGRGNGAAVVYALVGLLSASSFGAVWAYASRGRRLLHPAVDAAHVRRMHRDNLFGIGWFAAAAAVALASFWGAVAMFLLPFVVYALPWGPRATHAAEPEDVPRTAEDAGPAAAPPAQRAAEGPEEPTPSSPAAAPPRARRSP